MGENLAWAYLQPFLVGSLSGSIASAVIQPIDTIKVIIQSKRESAGKKIVNLSPFFVGKEIIHNNGVVGTLWAIKVSTKDWILLYFGNLFTVESDLDYSKYWRMEWKKRKRETFLLDKRLLFRFSLAQLDQLLLIQQIWLWSDFNQIITFLKLREEITRMSLMLLAKSIKNKELKDFGEVLFLLSQEQWL